MEINTKNPITSNQCILAIQDKGEHRDTIVAKHVSDIIFMVNSVNDCRQAVYQNETYKKYSTDQARYEMLKKHFKYSIGASCNTNSIKRISADLKLKIIEILENKDNHLIISKDETEITKIPVFDFAGTDKVLYLGIYATKYLKENHPELISQLKDY